jgi:hypothetical protein
MFLFLNKLYFKLLENTQNTLNKNVPTSQQYWYMHAVMSSEWEISQWSVYKKLKLIKDSEVVPVLNYTSSHEEQRYSFTRWRQVVSFMLWPHKRPWYPMDSSLDGTNSQSGDCVEVKNILPLPENEPWPSSPSVYQMSYPSFITADTSTKTNQ